MVFLTYLSFDRIQNLIEYGQLVEDSNKFKYKIEQCISYLKDSETAQRGFLLTNDSTFLQPMQIASKKIYVALNELAELAKTDNENIELVKKFNILCVSRMHNLEKLAIETNSLESYSGENKGKLIWGKQLMDDTRAMVIKMNEKIDRKLKKQESLKNKYIVITPIFMIGLSFVSLLLIFAAYRIVDNELKKRITMQGELQYNIEALSRSNNELEQFAYVASHDLQEPLRKIQSFGNRLVVKHKSNLDQDGQFIIDRMQNSAERMQLLINDLLTYSRVTNAQIKKFAFVDLNQSLSNVLDVLNDEIVKKAAIITTDKLPKVAANETQMEQLFQNLLTNALKFIPEDRKAIISIKCTGVTGKEIETVKPVDENKQFYKIAVTDNGIGFEEQYRDKIFVIFQRLEGKSAYSGSGIGLAVCKKIIQNHGGYINAYSKVNVGSQFFVYLNKPTLSELLSQN